MEEKNREEMKSKDVQLKELLSKIKEEKPQPTTTMGYKDAKLGEKERWT